MKRFDVKRLTALLAITIFMGASLKADASSVVALDVVKKAVYSNKEADTIIAAYDSGHGYAEDLYDGMNFMLYGIVERTDSNKEFRLKCLKASSSTYITCNAGSVVNEMSGVKSGDIVAAYGKMNIGTWFGGSLEMTVKGIKKVTDTTINPHLYTMLNGSSIDSTTMVKRTLDDNQFVYKIPRAWEEVEYALPNVKGYQYKLNELDGSGISESFFVFYIDETYLKDRGAINKSTKVQKAVVLDILNGVTIRHKNTPLLERDFDMATLDADYASFASYSGNYLDPNKNNYRVEFMFLPAEGKNNLRCLLYVYQKEKHVDDILLMMRNMEIK